MNSKNPSEGSTMPGLKLRYRAIAMIEHHSTLTKWNTKIKTVRGDQTEVHATATGFFAKKLRIHTGRKTASSMDGAGKTK